jgi:hypothetical protein
MSRSIHVTRLSISIAQVGLLGGILMLAGCAGSAPQSRASAAQRIACGHRADEVFQLQNRGAVYQSDQYVSSTRDAPFSSLGTVGVQTTSLSDLYARDKIQSDCIDGINGAPGPAPKAETPATK